MLKKLVGKGRKGQKDDDFEDDTAVEWVSLICLSFRAFICWSGSNISVSLTADLLRLKRSRFVFCLTRVSLDLMFAISA